MEKKIKMSPGVEAKLHKKHCVSFREVEECFDNQIGKAYEDTAEDHQTDPTTWWFIAETNHRKLLAIYYMLPGDGWIHIKTAFPPEQARINHYELLRAFA